MVIENTFQQDESNLSKQKFKLDDLKELGKALGSWAITLAATGAFVASVAYGSFQYAKYEKQWAEENDIVRVWPMGRYVPRDMAVKR